MNGVRWNIINPFNAIAKTKLSKEQLVILSDLRDAIAVLCLIYEDNDPLFVEIDPSEVLHSFPEAECELYNPFSAFDPENN